MTVHWHEEEGVCCSARKEVVACLTGIARPGAISHWWKKNMPRERDVRGVGKVYVLRDIVKWIYEVHVVDAIKGNSHPAVQLFKQQKEEATKSKAELEEIKLKQQLRNGDLVYLEKLNELTPREHVREMLMRSGEKYRNAGELLGKHHGPDAQQILLDAIDAVESDMEAFFDGE